MSGERSRLQQESFWRKKGREKVCERKNKKVSENARKTASAQYVDQWGEGIALLHSVVQNNNLERTT